jgi:hypothetical protein
VEWRDRVGEESILVNLESLENGKDSLVKDKIIKCRAPRAMIRSLESELVSARETIKDSDSWLADSKATFDEMEAALKAEDTRNLASTDTIRYLEHNSISAKYKIGEFRDRFADLKSRARQYGPRGILRSPSKKLQVSCALTALDISRARSLVMSYPTAIRGCLVMHGFCLSAASRYIEIPEKDLMNLA